MTPSVPPSPWADRAPASGWGRRVAAQLTVLALLAAATSLVIEMAPEIVGAAVRPQVTVARRGWARTMRTRGYALPPESAGHPAARAKRRRGGANSPHGTRDVGVIGTALAPRDVVMRSSPTDDAPVALELPAGSTMFVVKEVGPWLFCISTQDMKSGWVRKVHVSMLR